MQCVAFKMNTSSYFCLLFLGILIGNYAVIQGDRSHFLSNQAKSEFLSYIIQTDKHGRFRIFCLASEKVRALLEKVALNIFYTHISPIFMKSHL